MFRQPRRSALDQGADVGEKSLQFRFFQLVGQRVVAPRLDPLAQHHLQPTRLGEQLVGVAEDQAGTRGKD